MFLFIALLTITLGGTLGGDPCPPRGDIVPCSCSRLPLNEGPFTLWSATKKMFRMTTPNCTTPLPTVVPIRNESFHTVVKCEALSSVTELEKVVSDALYRKRIDRLIITHLPPREEYMLVWLPSKLLKDVRIKEFEIKNSKLAGDFIWKEKPFEGQSQSLLWFTATQCYLSGVLAYDRIGTVNTRGLNDLLQLEGINFSYNHLISIESTSFQNPPANLTTVILSHNSIQKVDSSAFSTIPKLKHVDFSHNLLESITRSIFSSPARELQYLDFSWNKLRTLPTDFFSNMSSLKFVNMAHNFLYSIPENPWKNVWRQLKFVDVTDNFIKCDCSLVWLLPILSPTIPNEVSTSSPRALPGQIVRGYCSRSTQPPYVSTQNHDLISLTRDKLNC